MSESPYLKENGFIISSTAPWYDISSDLLNTTLPINAVKAKINYNKHE